MGKKVYELAKEMNISSKELQEKANSLGIMVKSHMSVLSEADIDKIHGGGSETKIIKSEKAQHLKESPDEPKVTVKAVARTVPERKNIKPPIGKPIVDTAYLESKGKAKAPVGKPMPKAVPLTKDQVAQDLDAKEVGESSASKPLEKREAKLVAEVNTEETKKEESFKIQTPKIEVQKPAEVKDEPKKIGTIVRPSENTEATSDKPKKASYVKTREYEKKAEFVKKDNYKSGERTARPSKDGKSDRPYRQRDDRNSDRREGRDSRDGRKFSNDRDGYQSQGRKDGFKKNDRTDRGDRNDRPGRSDKGGRFDGEEGSQKNDRRSGGQKSFAGRNQRSEKPVLDKLEIKTDHSKRAEHKKNQDKYDKSKHDKFNKFEKGGDLNKNLEKKARKKHVKAKPQVEEVEVMEEILPEGTIVLNVPITVAGFCEQTEVSQAKVIMSLMKLGIMANINQTIDEDTVSILAADIGIDVVIGKVEEELVEEGLETFEDKEEDLKTRSPIITVMGHVDHGKTSLLDAIRKTNVTSSESGGITQHIGASEVRINGQKIVFLDTPGHEAFTAMRARGAHVTDIAVLVVAADDSVKPQTIESISHAKAAGVPIIVAINKMDKPAANPDRVKQDLTEHGLLVEDWGGDIISVPVSAKTGEGIVNLLEMILLQAEMLELKANPSRLAMGSVIEARLDKAKGPVATLLVTNGTLQTGQSIVAGTCSGRIRLMTDFKGKTIKKAGPATAVEILGLTEVPQAGDEFNAVKEDKLAREIAESRKQKLREEVLARNSSTTLEKLFSQIQEGEVKELNLIIKGDVQGSVGALVASLEKLNNEEVKVNIIHTGVGTVNESDVTLAGTTGSIIIGFNVRPSTAVTTFADRENIEIRTYRVIYDVIDDVENAMKGMLDPEFKEEILGKVEIRNTFKVPGVGIIGGAYVTEGKVVRNAEVRLVRDGIVIHEGKISSLKRFKDDAKEVATGYECGIGIEAYNDIKEGDIIECFHMVEIERN